MDVQAIKMKSLISIEDHSLHGYAHCCLKRQKGVMFGMERALLFCDYVEPHCHNGSKPRACPGNESTSTVNQKIIDLNIEPYLI